MNMLNQVILEGNVARSEEVETREGNQLLSLVIASERVYRNAAGERESETSFVVCEAWGDLGRAIASRCTEGRGVRIVGRLRQNRRTNACGRECSETVVIAEHVEFAPLLDKAGKKEE